MGLTAVFKPKSALPIICYLAVIAHQLAIKRNRLQFATLSVEIYTIYSSVALKL